jgi:hypothetical protein
MQGHVAASLRTEIRQRKLNGLNVLNITAARMGCFIITIFKNEKRKNYSKI